MTKVLVVATSRKTRGGITSVIKAHETGEQWKKYHCRWIETHRDGNAIRKLWYLFTALIEYIILLPFYDIVHIHVGLLTSVDRKLLFAKIAKFFHKKIIIHFHPSTEKHLFDDIHSAKIKLLFDYADLLIVLSEQWRIWINSAFADRRYNMTVLYNPCPKVKRDFSKKEKIILYAGMLSDRKGYNRLLYAFSSIAKKYPEWKLVFAGNGEIDKAKKLQHELNIPDNQVDFLGWVSGNEKECIFQKASIYCLPSWGEGFPMGVLDALAYGIPIITTPVGGIENIILNGKSGIIYDTYNIKELTKCLEILIDSESLRKNIIKEADKLVYNDFNINNVCQQLSEIYSKISK